MGPYSATTVANYFIERAGTGALTHLKLQKLLYFAHGWYLALNKKPLIKETLEAWNFGPVIPQVFRTFKRFGMRPIDMLALESNPAQGELFQDPAHKLPKELREFLDQIYVLYRDYTATQLSNMTHQPGTPWAITVARFGGDPPDSTPISNELIRDCFQGQLKSLAQNKTND